MGRDLFVLSRGGLSLSIDSRSKGLLPCKAFLGTCMAAESLLENDKRLQDAIEFFVHNLERSLHLVKREGMGGHERWIDSLHLQYSQQALHAQAATGAQTRFNGLFRHADPPLNARDMHEISLTVVANIGDGTTGFRDCDGLLEGDI